MHPRVHVEVDTGWDVRMDEGWTVADNVGVRRAQRPPAAARKRPPSTASRPARPLPPLSYYETVESNAVRPKAAVPFAATLAAWASADLRLPTLTVRWFTKRRGPAPWVQPGSLSDRQAHDMLFNMTAPKTLSGCFTPSTPTTIYLRTVRTPGHLTMNLLHEARHAWQHAHGWPLSSGHNPAAETDAESYARRAYPSAWKAAGKLICEAAVRSPKRRPHPRHARLRRGRHREWQRGSPR